MKKFMNLCSNIFKGKTNSIISIVALIECIILVVFTAYSWIETQSSLVIKGDDLPIALNHNYRFDIKEGGSVIDLATYYRPTALYQLGQASTTDAKNFYFKKSENIYRLGDTTDYNTSYYNIDFQVHNTTRSTYNYYFNTANIFEVTSTDESVTQNMLDIAAGAMRIAVTTGSGNVSNTTIYSISPRAYNAVSNNEVNFDTGVGTTPIITKSLFDNNGVFDPKYVYVSGQSNEQSYVFSSVPSVGDTKVNFKIWFEERDPEYQNLNESEKQALLGATVKINFQFTNAASNLTMIYFDDYTFNTAEGHEGEGVSLQDPNKSIYFHYTNANKEVAVIPMIKTNTSTDGVVHWATASDDGVATPRFSDDMSNHLSTAPADGYFFYGTYDSKENKVTNTTYKWTISKPMVNSSAQYIFKALSVGLGSNGSDGYGVWDNTEVELWKFKDQTASATNDDYNANGYQFITKAGTGLYITDSTTFNANKATRMYYDSKTGLWKGYFIKENVTTVGTTTTRDDITPVFNFVGSSKYTSVNNIKVQWDAGIPADRNDGERYFTALGYEGTGVVNNLSNASGVGTWYDTERILLSTELVDASSTELVDASMNKDYRYKIGIHIDNSYKYYYMTKNDTLKFGVYVPKGIGEDPDYPIHFQRFANTTDETNDGTWITTDRDSSTIYYTTDNTSNGQWHIGVFVDGSADNVVNDVLTNVEGSKLEYSVDNGVSYSTMNKLDNHRYYTNNFKNTVDNIIYRWTAYPADENGRNETVFSYGHSLSNGIYFSIMESTQD